MAMRYRLRATHGTPNPLTYITLPVGRWHDTHREAEDAARAYELENPEARVVIHGDDDVARRRLDP